MIIPFMIKTLFSLAIAIILAAFSYIAIGLAGATFIGVISFVATLVLSIFSYYSGLRFNRLKKIRAQKVNRLKVFNIAQGQY